MLAFTYELNLGALPLILQCTQQLSTEIGEVSSPTCLRLLLLLLLRLSIEGDVGLSSLLMLSLTLLALLIKSKPILALIRLIIFRLFHCNSLDYS